MRWFGIKSKEEKAVELARASAITDDAMRQRFKTIQELVSTATIDGLSMANYPAMHPSKLVQKQGIEVFTQMPIDDDMVNFARANLLLSVIAPGFEYIPADSEQPKDVEAAEFQEANFAHARGTEAQMILDQLGCITDGFAVAEPIYEAKPVAFGPFAGKRFYKQIVSKGVKYIEFKTDDFNDIEDEGVWQLNYMTSAGSYTKVPLTDVIYSVHWPVDNSPWGSSLLISAYRPYIFKQVVWQSMGRFFEHYGVPWPTISVEDDKFWALQTDSSALTRLKTFMKDNIKRGFNITPKSMEMGSNSTADISGRTTAYMEAMTIANRSIGRALWNPALMGEDTEHSTKAATEVQTVTQFERFLNFEAQSVMDAWNRQAILPSHLLNYGEGVGCPEMRIKPYSQDNMLIQAQIMEIGANFGAVFDAEATYEMFGWTQPQDGKPTIGGRQLSEQPSALPPFAPEEAKEAEKLQRKDLSYDVIDMLQRQRDGRKMPVERMYNFPTNGNGNNRLAGRTTDMFQTSDDSIKQVEALVDFSKADTEEDADADVWENYAGGVLKEIAQLVEDSAPKS